MLKYTIGFAVGIAISSAQAQFINIYPNTGGPPATVIMPLSPMPMPSLAPMVPPMILPMPPALPIPQMAPFRC